MFMCYKELKNVILSLKHLWYSDLDGLDALQEMVEVLQERKIEVYLAGIVHENVKNGLEKHPFYQEKVSKNMVFASYFDCLKELEVKGN
jgi:MFS superfamily sulfate permease-like transporter